MTFIAADHLRKIQYLQQENFSLCIDSDQNNKFTCIQITRCLPGKRISCLGFWDEKKIFAKLFIAPKRAKKHWQKELQGIKLLSEKNILSARLLHSGNTCNKEIYFIFFEYIVNTKPLQELWNQSSPIEQSKIMSKLLKTIANHHDQGILQKDLHLNNFILSSDTIYTLDASDIVSFNKNNKDEAYQNLAQLFAQLPPSQDKQIESVITTYAKYRQWTLNENCLTQLTAQTIKERNKRKLDYMVKTKRECALFCVNKSWTQLCVYSRKYHSDDLLHLLASPDAFIETGEFLKQGKSSTVSIITLGDKKWVIKRYNIKNWLHFLRRALRPSRAQISWHNTNLLSFYGIQTPAPIAMIEKRFGPIRKTAYFITEYSPGQTYWDFLYQSKPSNEEKENIAQSITTLLQSLKSLKISHGDLKISNIMIDKGCASLIDLDAMKQHSSLGSFQKAHKKDIKRFFKNWDDDVDNGIFFNKDDFFTVK